MRGRYDLNSTLQIFVRECYRNTIQGYFWGVFSWILAISLAASPIIIGFIIVRSAS